MPFKPKIYTEEAIAHFTKVWNECDQNPGNVAEHTGWARSTVYHLARKFGLFTKETRNLTRPKPRPVLPYKMTDSPTYNDITRNIVALIRERGY